MKFLLPLLFLIFHFHSGAQTYMQQNITLLSLISPNKDTTKSAVGNKYSGCWGWHQASKNKEYAISGASDGTYFIDVSSPSTPSVSAFVPGRKGSSWREMKTYQNYCYIVCDDAQPNKFTIVDMQYLPDSVHVVHYGNTYFERGHTIWIDNNRMYIGATTYSSGSSAMTVWSLSTPTAPYLLRRVEQDVAPPVFSYVHDMYVRNDTVYASTGWQGLHILKYNTSDTTFSPLGSYAGYNQAGYNHSSSLTQNGKYLLFCDESPSELPMHFVDVQNPGNVQPVNTFRPAARSTSHNPYILGNKWAVVSCYQDGIYIFDISNPPLISEVGFFDTFPQGGANIGSYPDRVYNGAWSSYPYLPSGILIANDMQNGVFILDPSASYSNTAVNPVGLSQQQPFQNELTVFPNPASEYISVKYIGGKNAQVEIRNLLGQQVYRSDATFSELQQITVKDLVNGSYELILLNGDRRISTKLIIHHE